MTLTTANASASPTAGAATPKGDPHGCGHDLRAVELSLAYDDRLITERLSLCVPQGKVTVIVGANACGKSTLLRGLARLLKAKAGWVLLDGRDIRRLPTREVATRLGILPQHPPPPRGSPLPTWSAGAATPPPAVLPPVVKSR